MQDDGNVAHSGQDKNITTPAPAPPPAAKSPHRPLAAKSKRHSGHFESIDGAVAQTLARNASSKFLNGIEKRLFETIGKQQWARGNDRAR